MSNEHPGESAAGPSAGPAHASPHGPSTSPSSQGPQGRRPSLNVGSGAGSAQAPSAHGEPSTSILQALSSTMQMAPVTFTEPRPVAWKPWAAAAVVAALAAAGWAAFVGSRSTQSLPQDHVVAEVQPPVAQAVVPAPVPVAATTPASVASAASAVARIEDLPSTAAAVSAAPAVDASTPRLPVVAATQPAAIQPAAPVPAARPRVARYEARSEAGMEVRSEARSETRPEARPERRPEVRSEPPRRKDLKLAMVDGRTAESPSQAAARSVSAPTATRQDSDVDLMAALLDHMAATDAGSNAAAATTPGVRKAAIATPSNTTRAAPSNTTRPTTISGLVASCKDAGDKRAVSECRKRICKGYWGKAEACPARLAPTAAARKRSTG